MTSTTNVSTVESSAHPDINREIAIAFLSLAAKGRAGEAMERYAATDFVHHNPWFRSDAQSLAEAMDENARQNPDKVLEVLRTIAEGSLVAVHARVQHKPGEPSAAVMHIFRIEGDLIREMWDVGQEAPADSPNQAGMF
jgi:predicted SnoaL-like aldol condensation-catalyzing enzyme